jgi:hypothetical protein
MGPEHVIGINYSLTNKAVLNFRLRYYWSAARNKEYFILNENGSLTTDPGYRENHNENYNAFNIDLTFKWVFAPGSELSLDWKNAILVSDQQVNGNYWKNLSNTWNSNQTNSLSLLVLYYINCNSLRSR